MSDEEPELVVLGDVMTIVRAQVAQLMRQSEHRLLAPDETLSLKRYHEILIDCTREKRRADDEDVDDMSYEQLLEHARRLAGGGK